MNNLNKEYDVDEFEFKQAQPTDIFAYNELRSCSDLVNLFKKGILEIQPDYQRNEIWPLANQARFIDSLIKEMPIPSMCFSYDKPQNKMKVIDGLQRMSTMIRFLDLKNEFKMSSLKDIDDRISGKTNIEIYKKNSEIFENISNLSLPVTFLRVSHDSRDHNEYIFQIFHRLNTYGKTLNPQEIRNCIYSGEFNTLLKTLNKNRDWKKVLKFSEDTRFANTELILRFFSFYEGYMQYEGPLTKHLNDYMADNRNVSSKILSERTVLFNKTVSEIANKIFNKESSFKKPSKVVMETLMFGVAKNLQYVESLSESKMQTNYKKLLKDKSLSESEISESIMRKDKVKKRFSAALKIFSKA
jgi:hypothetical protein